MLHIPFSRHTVTRSLRYDSGVRRVNKLQLLWCIISCLLSQSLLPADTNRWAVAGLVLGRRRRWWTRADLAAGRRGVCTGSQLFLNLAYYIVLLFS